GHHGDLEGASGAVTGRISGGAGYRGGADGEGGAGGRIADQGGDPTVITSRGRRVVDHQPSRGSAVSRLVCRASEGRLFRVGHHDGEGAGGSVAGRIGRGASHRGRSFREGSPGGWVADQAGDPAVVPGG